MRYADRRDMRPGILEHGHRLRARLFMRMAQGVARQRIDPVAQMALYRPQFFGDAILTLASEVLRGPSFWTAAEREHLAVFTSRLNHCPFCVRVPPEHARP